MSQNRNLEANTGPSGEPTCVDNNRGAKGVLINTALELCKTFAIIPVDQNKLPLLTEWKPYQTRKPTEDEVRAWWTEWPDANIGLVCGKINDLTVVDADDETAAEKIEALLPEQAEIPIVSTPRGKHYYFSYCPGLKSRNRVKDGIDVKSEGGYVLCPPSRTVFGPYHWIDGFDLKTPRGPLPEKLLEFLKIQGPSAGGVLNTDKGILTEGNRDNYLFHAALQFFKDSVPLEEVKKIIVDMGKVCKPPFPEKEALAKVQSAYDRVYGKGAGSQESKPRLVSRRVADIEIEPISWLWQDIIPLDMVTAICGDPGVGKSFLCVDIAARVSRGDRFRKYRDEAPPVIGDVIYITSELLPSQILKPRLVAADADANRITVITGIYKKDGEIDMFDVDHLPLLKEHILKDQGRVKLVVIDPIASHLKKGTNILDTVDTRRVMDTIANFAETAHVASLVSFHLNKDTTKQALHRIAGSMQFIASVKSAWAVTEDSGGDENRRYFAPIKNNLATTKKSLPFLLKDTPMKDKNGNRICTARILWDSEPTFIDLGRIISPRAEGDRSQTDKAKDLLREQLKGGQRPARELFKLAEQQGISADILKRAKEQMHVKGDRLGFQGPVFWFFPDTDKEAS